jgi:hypothetical protein
MHYLHIVHARDVLHGGPFNFSSESLQIFFLLLLMLVNGGCHNYLLPADLFVSNSTHLSLGHGYRFIISTLGISIINVRFPRY